MKTIQKNKTLVLIGVIVLVLLVVAFMANNTKSLIGSRASSAKPIDTVAFTDVVKVADEKGNAIDCKQEGVKYVCETSGEYMTIGLADQRIAK